MENEVKNGEVHLLIDKLRTLSEGLRTMHVQTHLLDQTANKLRDQTLRVEELEGSDLYQSGRKDGHDAAFATGLVGDDG